MNWFQRLCRHDWRHHFDVSQYEVAISCRCARCGKRRKPDHTWPRPGDEIETAPGIELVDELEKLR